MIWCISTTEHTVFVPPTLGSALNVCLRLGVLRCVVSRNVFECAFKLRADIRHNRTHTHIHTCTIWQTTKRALIFGSDPLYLSLSLALFLFFPLYFCSCIFISVVVVCYSFITAILCALGIYRNNAFVSVVLSSASCS